MVTELKLVHPKYIQLKEDQARLTAELKRAQQGITKEAIDAMAELVRGEEFQNFITSRLETQTELTSHFFEYADSFVVSQQHTYEFSANKLRRIKNDLAEVNDYLDVYSESYEAESLVTIKAVRTALKGIPCIKPRSITMGTENSKPFIRWVFTGLALTPDDATLRGVIRGELPPIPLGDIACYIYPVHNEVQLRPLRGERDAHVYTWASKTRVHPHVLGHDHPCLGTTTYSLYDAFEQRDWATTALLLKSFLESATSGDSAGIQWTKNFRIKELYTSLYTFCSLVIPDGYIEYDGLRWYLEPSIDDKFNLILRPC